MTGYNTTAVWPILSTDFFILTDETSTDMRTYYT